MTTRIHSYGNIVPADYDLVLTFEDLAQFDDFGGVTGSHILRDMTDRLVAARSSDKFEGEPGVCCVCGGYRHKSGAIFRHNPTGALVEMGWQCAEKVDLEADRTALSRFRAARKELTLAFLARADRRARLRLFVAEHATDGLLDDLRVDHPIIKSIRRQASSERGLSPRQVEVVRKIANESRNVSDAKPSISVPEFSGRVEITGRILSIKTIDSDYGPQDKMLVEVDGEGGSFKLYGTAPAKLYDESERLGLATPYFTTLRGMTVSFVAKVERSRKDETFGFFSRPTKVRVSE